jgi:hypothetical protein
VKAPAVLLRDLADGVYKPQVVVSLPSLPLGPASISVTGSTAGGVVITVPDSAFTVAPTPVAISADYGRDKWSNFQAAVGRDGTVYLALDLTNVSLPMVFEAQALGWPLRFGSQDIVFYNAQGFLMQHLVTAGLDPIPGMFVFPPQDPSTDSDLLHYSRHEFTTYFLQHQERQPHAVDPLDPNWHLDGTPHVDHNHLILAIMGHLNNGKAPAPGATPSFTLMTATFSLFYRGLVGVGSINMNSGAAVDSYSSSTRWFGSAGDVFTNGTLNMSSYSKVKGSANACSIKLSSGATITGQRNICSSTTSFLQIILPTLIPNIGDLSLNRRSTTLTGPGSFQVASVNLVNNSKLFVDNSAGPVTLYVTGGINIEDGSDITIADPNPEKFALYVVGSAPVSISEDSTFYGVVYAPNSSVSLSGAGEFFGAFVGNSVTLTTGARAHYYSALKGQ